MTGGLLVFSALRGESIQFANSDRMGRLAQSEFVLQPQELCRQSSSFSSSPSGSWPIVRLESHGRPNSGQTPLFAHVRRAAFGTDIYETGNRTEKRPHELTHEW